MIYKNSLKVMMSNFSLVSRILLFMLIHFAIIFGLSYMLILPIINLLSANGFFKLANEYYISFLETLNARVALQNIDTLFDKFIQILSQNFSVIGVNIIAFLFVIFVFGAFLNNFYSLIVTNSLYYSMSNNTKFQFLPSMLATFKDNLKYSFISLFTKLPLALINFMFIILSFRLLTVGGLVTFFAPLLIILIILTLSSFKMALFYGWSPAIIIFDKGVFYAFDKSLKLSFRKLKKVYANSFYIVLTVFVVNVLSALVTFGASLIITIPMSVLLVNSFSMVLFYSNYGMRYYVDEFNVIVPVKLEQTEPLSSIKFII